MARLAPWAGSDSASYSRSHSAAVPSVRWVQSRTVTVPDQTSVPASWLAICAESQSFGTLESASVVASQIDPGATFASAAAVRASAHPARRALPTLRGGDLDLAHQALDPATSHVPPPRPTQSAGCDPGMRRRPTRCGIGCVPPPGPWLPRAPPTPHRAAPPRRARGRQSRRNGSEHGGVRRHHGRLRHTSRTKSCFEVVDQGFEVAAVAQNPVRVITGQGIVGLAPPVNCHHRGARHGRAHEAPDDFGECRGVEVVGNLAEDHQVERACRPRLGNGGVFEDDVVGAGQAVHGPRQGGGHDLGGHEARTTRGQQGR